MQWSRLLLKARFQGVWVLATYSQIRYSMSPWKCLWQQLCRLQIANQKRVTVKHQCRLLLQHQQLHGLMEATSARDTASIQDGSMYMEEARKRLENKVAERKGELRELLQMAATNEPSQACWHQAELARIPIDGAEQDIKVATSDLTVSLAHARVLQSRASAKATEAIAALAREAALPRPLLAFHYWAAETFELFQRRMARARRMTYLFLRAVEHDLQRNYNLDAAVINATHPQQLHDIAMGLGDELIHGMEQRRPEPSFRIVSLCKDVLRLPELNHETDCNGPKSQRRFREILYSPANAVYEAGEYLGQNIPFRLTPAGLTTRWMSTFSLDYSFEP